MNVKRATTVTSQKENSFDVWHKVMTPVTLPLYDAYVLGFSSRFIWRCPQQLLKEHYNRNVTGRHLDIGVGTGALLDRATFPTTSPKITLMDLNEHCLASAADRISRYHPEKVVANILDPVPATGEYDSVGMNYLLHCLPGDISQKAVLFDNIRHLFSPNVCVFGATIVQGDAPRSLATNVLLKLYNKYGMFSNTNDRYDDLKQALEQRFKNVQMRLQGCVALFEAREPR